MPRPHVAVAQRPVGTGLFVDLHVQADPEMPLRESHTLSGRVKAAIRAAVPAAFDTSIHLEPYEPPTPTRTRCQPSQKMAVKWFAPRPHGRELPECRERGSQTGGS